MRTRSRTGAIYFEGRFWGRQPICRSIKLPRNPCVASQYESHRLRQDTVQLARWTSKKPLFPLWDGGFFVLIRPILSSYSQLQMMRPTGNWPLA